MSYNNARAYTNMLINMIDDGVISAEAVFKMCMDAMSEDDVRDMMVANELVDCDDDDC